MTTNLVELRPAKLVLIGSRKTSARLQTLPRRAARLRWRSPSTATRFIDNSARLDARLLSTKTIELTLVNGPATRKSPPPLPWSNRQSQSEWSLGETIIEPAPGQPGAGMQVYERRGSSKIVEYKAELSGSTELV